MKNYTCWITKYSSPSSTMPHGLVKLAAPDLDEARVMAGVLTAELCTTDLLVWHETLGEMSGLGDNALWPLVVWVNGEERDTFWGTFMVAGRTRQEAMANTLELAAWLQYTDVAIDVKATLAQPEWQEVPA